MSMKSLFDKADNEEIVVRINRLTPSSDRQWGKMTVDQMLVHTQRPLQVAFGELKLKRTLAGVLFGGFVRKAMTKDEKPFGRNSPTDKSFIVSDSHDVDKGKKALITLVRRFAEVGPAGMTKDPHPFFGKMTTSEWDIIQWKHLDHHLRQFGV